MVVAVGLGEGVAVGEAVGDAVGLEVGVEVGVGEGVTVGVGPADRWAGGFCSRTSATAASDEAMLQQRLPSIPLSL